MSGNAMLFRLPTICCWLIGCLLCPGILGAADSATPTVVLGEPYLAEETVYLDVSFSGFLTGRIVDALQSGLPATLVIEWRVQRERDGWWDKEASTGATFYRVYFDVLQQHFDAFNHNGRPLTSAEELLDVEAAIARQCRLELGKGNEFHTGRWYYIEVFVRIDPLDEDEIVNLEEWLRGESQRDHNGNILATLSRQAESWVKELVGPGKRTAWARTESFRRRQLQKHSENEE
ncbi:MAG: DUF4390 domain-containing protein [bacterium]